MAETVEEATLQRSRVHFCRIFGVIPFCDRFLIDSIRGCEIFGVMLLLFASSENNLRLQEKTAKNGQKGQKKRPAVSQVLESEWCRRRDSNPHAIAGARF